MITIPKNQVTGAAPKPNIPPEFLLMAQAVQSTLGPQIEKKPNGK